MELKTNLHHEAWMAREWKKYRFASLIRDHDLMKSVMVIPIHNELHRYVDPLTAPSADMGRLLLSHLNHLPGSYTQLDAAESIYNDLHEEAPEYSEHMGKQIPFLKLSARALARRVV